MKFPYMAVSTRQPVPSLAGQLVRHRPVIAVLLAGTATPQLRDGLLDTGADDTVFSEAVASDEETSAYVAELEQRAEELDAEENLPSGETLAAELTRFLRERERGNGGPEEGPSEQP